MSDQPEWTGPEGQRADQPIHTVPVNDIREHVTDSMFCPCMPRLVPPDPVMEDGELCQPESRFGVIRHNSYDGREVPEVLLRALDEMGKALTEHDHEWAPSLRSLYEQAVDLVNLHLVGKRIGRMT